ncbi:MAG: FAD:protein FMN transferase [Gemmatimonadetes bacterium]|nr:FAD:protein FMN transferase [Gemmatimonadota bacterium]
MPADSKRGLSRRQALRITAVTGLSLAAGGSVVASLLRRARLHQVRETRTQMGTLVTVTVVHPSAATARAMVAAAFAEIARLERILSRHQDGTPVARLNREGFVTGAPAELLAVVRRALHYSDVTDGAFDITVAPLLSLYTSRLLGQGVPPAPSEVEQALSLVGYRAVQVDGSDIAFAKPGMAITLDGIAKGFVVDRTVGVLLDWGAERVMVAASGDIASAGGSATDDHWRVAIQDPRDAHGSRGVLRLHGECVATSGDYMQSFTPDRNIHHILDPRTGRSPDHTSAVTIVASTAMDADALSTSVFVLGPQRGLQLLDRLDRVEGLIITKDQTELRTRGFARYLA